MQARRLVVFTLVFTALVLVGCAAKRPVLYPNETVEDVGWEAANRDIDECVAAAEAYGAGGSPATRAAGSTVRGSATGAATGAAVGAVLGGDGRYAGAGRSAAAGAAGGAAGGLVRGLFRWRDPDPIKARFVNICLGRQGYQIIGWQ